MHKNIDEVEFTIFDTETTGLEPEAGDRIIEIAAIRLKAEREIAVFNSLVNPGRPVSEAAFAVNGITQEMLKGASSIEKVLPAFMDFIKDSCLCSYNAPFDLGFLNKELKICGRPALDDMEVVDMLKMARRLLPGRERYALMSVAGSLGVQSRQEHRALSDVKMTLEVFHKFKKILADKGISNYRVFFHLFGINSRALDNLNNQKIAQIQEAIDLGVRLKIRYLSVSGAQVTEREVVPKEIKQENRHIYLVGHCCLRDEERNFRIDGILHLEII